MIVHALVLSLSFLSNYLSIKMSYLFSSSFFSSVSLSRYIFSRRKAKVPELVPVSLFFSLQFSSTSSKTLCFLLSPNISIAFWEIHIIFFLSSWLLYFSSLRPFSAFLSVSSNFSIRSSNDCPSSVSSSPPIPVSLFFSSFRFIY